MVLVKFSKKGGLIHSVENQLEYMVFDIGMTIISRYFGC